MKTIIITVALAFITAGASAQTNQTTSKNSKAVTSKTAAKTNVKAKISAPAKTDSASTQKQLSLSDILRSKDSAALSRPDTLRAPEQ